MDRETRLRHAHWCIEQMAVLDLRALKTADYGRQYAEWLRLLGEDYRILGL